MKGRMRKLWGNEEVATCKLCGTPIKSGKRTCPLCGYVVGAESNVFYIAGDASGRRENKGARASAPPAPAGERIVSEFGNGRGLDEEVALMAEADGDLDVPLRRRLPRRARRVPGRRARGSLGVLRPQRPTRRRRDDPLGPILARAGHSARVETS